MLPSVEPKGHDAFSPQAFAGLRDGFGGPGRSEGWKESGLRQAADPLFFWCQLREGHVVLSVEGTGLQASSLQLEPGRANDGDWHHAQLALGASGGPGHAILSFDYGQQRAEGNLGPRLHGLHLSNITVGGVPGPAGGVARGFRGCLQVSTLTCLSIGNPWRPARQKANSTPSLPGRSGKRDS